jgi:N-acetylmuramoyl-L-alanine amidase
MISYTPRARTDYIAVHCSATKPSQNVDESEIRAWHQAKGWVDVGYNIVIPRNGMIQIGRPLDYAGAHVEGYNSRALGICLVGGIAEIDAQPENNFTASQFVALLVALRFCRLYAPHAMIQGHRDFPNVAKACPSFDVRAWLKTADSTLL